MVLAPKIGVIFDLEEHGFNNVLDMYDLCNDENGKFKEGMSMEEF